MIMAWALHRHNIVRVNDAQKVRLGPDKNPSAAAGTRGKLYHRNPTHLGPCQYGEGQCSYPYRTQQAPHRARQQLYTSNDTPGATCTICGVDVQDADHAHNKCTQPQNMHTVCIMSATIMWGSLSPDQSKQVTGAPTRCTHICAHTVERTQGDLEQALRLC